MNNTLLTKEDLLEKANAFRESRVLLTAIELNVFTILDTQLLTVEEISIKALADARALERLLSVLVGMGLLRKLKNKYYNTDLAKQHLNKNSDKFLGGLEHTSDLWNSWSTLTEAVKQGEAVIENNIAEKTSEWQENFIKAMHSRGKKQAELMSYIIDFSSVKKMIDIGGGSGAFSFAFIEKRPEIKSTIFDLKEIIPFTRKFVENSPYAKNIELIGGDFMKDDFPHGYDLSFLSAIIHMNSPEENERLFGKCFSSLNSGGKIIISDFIMNEDRLSPYNGAMFALNMLTGTKRGDTYTESEINLWLTKAGFSSAEFKETSFGTKLCVAQKQ